MQMVGWREKNMTNMVEQMSTEMAIHRDTQPKTINSEN